MIMRRIYEWFSHHRFLVDAVIAGLLWLALALPFVTQWVYFLISTALIVPLAWRRIRPVPAAAVMAGVAIIQIILALGIPTSTIAQPLPADGAVVLMVYALAAFARRWASLSGLGLALLGGALVTYTYFTRNYVDGTVFSHVAISALVLLLVWFMVLFAWAAGDLTRTRRLREQEFRDRARRLEVEQAQERELAASDERAHIAREMHDIVAHSLSVIITQADGARYAAAADPQIAVTTLGTIADAGRGSLKEMRRLLGVLRGGEATASTRPLPGLADVDELLQTYRTSGLALNLRTIGKARRELPGGAELTAYRVIQEALTNVLKHAGGQARAEVALKWAARGLQITVTDDGVGALAAQPTDGGGNGIRGMRERLALYDGSLAAGPRPGGDIEEASISSPRRGFEIRAFIPYTDA